MLDYSYIIVFGLSVFGDMESEIFPSICFEWALIGADKFRSQMPVFAGNLTLIGIEGEDICCLQKIVWLF